MLDQNLTYTHPVLESPSWQLVKNVFASRRCRTQLFICEAALWIFLLLFLAFLSYFVLLFFYSSNLLYLKEESQ